MPTIAELQAQLDKLAAFDCGPYPVLSLYLDLRSNYRGRDNFEPFLRNELAERVATFAESGPERESLNRDVEKVRNHVVELDSALNGMAVFSCSGADFFEAIPLLVAPLDGHHVHIGDQAHLYPLARLIDQYPRYLAVLADTHSARIFVFAANALEKLDHVEGVKTKRHKVGGWSQARYQRHVENFRAQHAKEVADVVSRIAREESIEQIVIAGDEVIVLLLRAELPKDIAERVIDVVKLGIRAPQREVLETTIAALRHKDAETDRERVDELIGAYRGNGLGVAGLAKTRKAFELGQVDELLLPGNADQIGREAADELIARASQTSATVRIIEDASLLAPLGGVGAFLRFRT
jgi:peptide chain release factor subunit 1